MKQHIKTVKELKSVGGNKIALDEVVKAAERYEFLRTLAPVEFTRLWQNNIHSRGKFDDLVDKMIAERK